MSAEKIDFERELNPQQLLAVTHGEEPQLVLAGAGSGKTRVITYRVAWLVGERGVDPAKIAAVTFTNKAAGEMKERIESLLGLYPLPTFVGTFHRYALRLLRIYGERVALPRNFAIFDSGDQLNLVKEAVRAEGLDEKAFRPQAILAAISGAKNRLLEPSRYERQADDFFSRRVAPVYRRYQKLLREASGVDFDDMIALSVKLLRDNEELRQRLRRRTRYLLVDEYQDTNHAQSSLIRELIGRGRGLTAVGDEDQGIYRWRGAELENILRFEESFPGAVVRKLERNYRSTQNILDAAGAVVENNRNRRGKKLWTEIGAGEKVGLYRGSDERDEARWIARVLGGLQRELRWSEMAVLVRTNAQTRALEEEFMRRGIPYLLIGATRFYERAEIKDLIAYLRFLRNPTDDFSLARILNRPPRGIGKTTQEQLRQLASASGQPMWELIGGDLGSIPARGAQALRRFHERISPLVEEAEDLLLPTLLERLLEATGYAERYDKDDEESRTRLENIQELLSGAREFTEGQGYGSEEEDLLTAFLDHVSLVSDTDRLGDGGVAVMTLHSAKGLEFQAVVVAGLEEGLLPHFNAQGPEDVEEERRLLYVGMTRARSRLFLTTCRRRMIGGKYQDREPSRFLAEVPESYLELEESSELFARRPQRRPGQESAIRSFFGRPAGAAPAIELGADDPPPWEEDESPARGRLRRGSRVRHPRLGTGRVLAVDQAGEDTRLTVYFDGKGRRKLVARYANLEVL